MLWITFIWREITRRPARSILTMAGLAVGVALVLLVTAMSRGVDDARQQVLDPLGTLATDLSVTRPVDIGDGGFAGIGEEEQKILEEENDVAALQFDNIGDPGDTFERDSFLPATQLTFEEALVDEVRDLDGVDAATGALTLLVLHQTGTVPTEEALAEAQRSGFAAFNSLDIEIDTYTAAGIDPDSSEFGLATADNVVDGEFFTADGGDDTKTPVMVSEAWAQRRELSVGDSLDFGGTTYTVVGIVKPAIGQPAADVYLPLEDLQELADREGRVNQASVRAERGDDVPDVRDGISEIIDDASVADSASTADKISGSLVDAADLSDRLGTGLIIVALVAAVGFAVLLTLTSVTRRTREFGTVRAVGWTSSQVVRQVLGETLVISAAGGAVGIGLAWVVAWVVGKNPITLEATGSGGSVIGDLGGGPGFGVGTVSNISEDVTVTIGIDPQLGLIAMALGIAGGLIAGGIGALRAARMQPADAFRQVE